MSATLDQTAANQRLLQALRQAHAALAQAERARSEAIAIVGIGCRLPGADGDIRDMQEYWQLLSQGQDAVTEVPAERWDNEAIYDEDKRAAGKTYTRRGAFLRKPDQFDAEFFGISPREAARLDPQQRLLLETAWEALTDAGLAGRQQRMDKAGVYIGIGQSHYGDLQLHPGALEGIDSFSGTGSLQSFASGRLSYWLGLEGPSLSVDTACSSSLVAVHLACQSLRGGETNLALAGGVHLNLAPHISVFLSRAGVLAPDGRTKAFDAAADGFGRGEGCVVIALKRLSDAQADGDVIHALIRGSAVNHDGAGAGLTVPSESSQAKVLRQALENAKVSPGQVGFIETHGTGTELGDPIELRALNAVFGPHHSAGQPLHLGAVKSSIGHLEAAAGLAGLLKAALALKHGLIPRQCHFSQPNPHIPWSELPFAVPLGNTPWPERQERRIAGVSAFGMSGTNAHVVLEAAPAAEEAAPAAEAQARLLLLSAHSRQALQERAGQIRDHIARRPEHSLADICVSAAAGHAPFEHRLALVCESREQALEQLAAWRQDAGAASADVCQGRAGQGDDQGRPVFLFTGQGSQYWDMGRELFQTEPRFRAMLERCAAILDPLLERPLLDVLHGAPEHRALIDRTDFTQPALFAVQVALAELWRGWGVEPAAVLGHSLGEYAAAWCAGVFSLEDGLRLVAARGRLMHRLPGNGGMAALRAADADALAAWLAGCGEPVSLSGFNSPQELVISGPQAAVRSVLRQLDARGATGRELAVSHAFHSPLMQPMLDEFARLAESVSYAPPALDMLSSCDGRWNAVSAPDYWCRQIVQPVRYRQAMAELAQRGYRLFLEIGPRPILCGLGRANLPGADCAWLASLNPGIGEARSLKRAMAGLFVRGAEPSADAIQPDPPRRRVPLPRYPFQRKRHWLPAGPARAEARALPPVEGAAGAALPLVGRRLPLPFSRDIRFETSLAADDSATLRDHQVFGAVVVAAAYHLAMVLEAAARVLRTTRLRLEDIRLAQALTLAPGSRRRVQVLLEAGADGAYAFRTMSCALDADPAAEDAWTSHASGRLRAPAASAATPSMAAPAGAAQLNADDFYAPLTEIGFALGPSYRWTRTLHIADSALSCRLSPPSDAWDDRDAGLHPGLLDTCFQTLSRLWPASMDELRRSGTLYVPFAIASLDLHAFPLPAHFPLACQARRQAGAGDAGELTAGADLQLRSHDGAPLLEVGGFQFRRTSQASLHGRDSATLALRWLDDARTPAAPAPAGLWLVLADRSSLGAELCEQLRRRGQDCQLIAAGAASLPPCDHVVDLRALDLRCAADSGADAVQALLLQGAASLQALLRELADAPRAPRLWLATRASQAAGNPVRWPALAQSALWGLAAVAAAEHPRLKPGCVDLDASPLPDEAARLAEALLAADGEDWLALRDGRRLLARLQPHAEPDATPLPIHADGSYLITGGFGALGLKLGEWLMRQGARCLVLSGRRLPDADSAVQATLDDWRKRGVQVHCIPADLGDASQAAALFDAIDRALPPLRGVAHAAGALRDGLLLQQDAADLAAVFAPKVAGSWHLHQQTRQRKLDFLALFSSAAALVGSRGQAGYAMANSFMDALAQARHADGLPALSVNWGAWAEIGMGAALPDAQRQRWRERGFGLIAPDQGMRTLGRLLGGDAAQLAVLPTDAATLAARHAQGKLAPRFFSLRQAAAPAAQSAPAAPSPASAPRSREQLDSKLRRIIAGTLGLDDPQQIEARARLFDLGFDSILALEAAEQLSRELGAAIHDTIIFEYPTLEALQGYLAGILELDVPAREAAGASDRPLSQRDIAALSDEEAERLLLAELQNLTESHRLP